jgi:hypothetical protein
LGGERRSGFTISLLNLPTGVFGQTVGKTGGRQRSASSRRGALWKQHGSLRLVFRRGVTHLDIWEVHDEARHVILSISLSSCPTDAKIAAPTALRLWPFLKHPRNLASVAPNAQFLANANFSLAGLRGAFRLIFCSSRLYNIIRSEPGIFSAKNGRGGPKLSPHYSPQKELQR